MKKSILFFVVIFIAGFSAANGAPEKNKYASAGQKNKLKPLVAFSVDMIKEDYIDKNFNGLSFSEVIKSIDRVNLQKKGEFESTIDFNRRKAAEIDGLSISGVKINNGLIAFVVPVKVWTGNGSAGGGGIGYYYNADEERLVFYVGAMLANFNGKVSSLQKSESIYNGKDIDLINLGLIHISDRFYSASNAVGGKIQVREMISDRLGIASKRMSFLDYERDSNLFRASPVTHIAMKSVDAEKESSVLKALIVMELGDPYVYYDYFSSKPTWNDPTEFISQGRYLAGDIKGIVFFSGLTGKILARLPNNFGRLNLDE